VAGDTVPTEGHPLTSAPQPSGRWLDGRTVTTNRGSAVTRPPDPPSAVDPLTSDPLADDYGSVLPPVPAGSALPPASPGSGPASTPSVTPAPDPTSDRFSAFDDPAGAPPVKAARGTRKRTRSTSRRGASPAPVAARGSSPKASSRSGQAPSSSSPPRRPAKGPRSGVARGVLLVVGALVLLPVVVGFALSRFVTDTADDDSADPAERPLVATEVSVPPTPVAELPAVVTSVHVELQGAGRTADVRLFTRDGSSTITNRVLPYAVDVPVATDDAYLSVSADDYGYRGSQPMRCTISVGDTVLSTAVGTQSVDCKVTDETWRRVR